MTWDYNETTHQALDDDGGNITPLTIQSVPGFTQGGFEPDEGYLGKYWATSTEPTIENTCFDGGASVGHSVQLDLGSGNEIDITSVLIQIWFLYTAKTGEVVSDSDGIKITVADSSSTGVGSTNRAEYILTGAVNGGISSTNDPNGVKTFYSDPAVKSWNSFVVGGANRVTTTVGTCDLTDIRYFGITVIHQSSNTGNNPAFAVDWYKSGNKFTCTGTETLEGLRSFDRGVPGDRGDNPDYGLERGSGIFYEILSKIDIGNGTTTTSLTVEDSFVNFNPFAEEIPYDWTVTNNGTLNLGRLDDQVQDDYPVGGCTLAAVDEVYISSIEFKNGSAGNIYRTRIFRFDDLLLGESAAGTDPNLDVRSCDFDTIRNIELRSDDLDLIDTIIHDPLPTFLDAGRAWQYDDSGTSYTNITTNWNNDTTTTEIFPTSEAVGDAHVFGYSEQFGAVEFEISTQGVAGVVVWEYWNGSSWSTLGNIVDGTNSFKANESDGAFNRYRVTWDLPSNWATTQLGGSGGQLYYVRARITTIFSTNPQIQQARIGQRRVGTLFVAPDSFTGNRIFKCDRGLRFAASVTVRDLVATDNAYDLVVDNTLTVTLVNSTFDPDKILQI